MKAEDLMIGDWVCEKDDTAYQYPMKVVSIDKKIIVVDFGQEFAVGYEMENRLADYDPNDLIPIPLTKEILKKNFQQRTEPWDFEFENPFGIGYCENIHYPDGTTKDYSVSVEDHILVQMQYVHELQHMIRMCRMDKEIKL